VTARDRLIIVVVLVAAALGGVWFVGLAPKRKEAADLQAQIETANQQLTDAQQKAAAARQAKSRYNKDYAAVATLGKAVPKSDALPSLLYQLQTAAHDARIDFRSLKVSAGGGQGPVASTPSTPANTASAANSAGAGTSSSGSGSSSSSASGSSSSSSSSSSTPSTPSSSTPAPATQAAAATLPPGAVVGSAGFPTMPFSFVFNGSFFDMEDFFNEVQRFVRVNGDRIDVSGRLLSIDSFSLVAGPTGFPSVKSSISATAYLLSPDDTGASSTATSSTATGSTSGGASTGGTSAPSTTGGATASEVAR
jgi:Type II secretion system (T2SS), protein M